jgi:hypothetical protein
MLRWLAGGLAVLATCAAAAGNGVQVTITVDGQQQVFQQDGSAAAGGLMQYEGDASGSEWTAEWDYSNNADLSSSDAQISGSTTFVNTSGQPKVIQFDLAMPVCPIVQNGTTIGGICSVLMNANGNGGSISCGSQNAVYSALVDGQAAALLFNCPFALSAGGNSTSSTSANFGAPLPSMAGPAIGDSIGVRFSITLTPGDTAVLGAYFIVAADESDLVACPPQIVMSEPLTQASGGSDLRAVALADLDDDGAADLLAVDGSANQLIALLNNGSGEFAVDGTSSTGEVPVALAAGDLDADGAPDVVVANRDDKSVSLYRNSGTGALANEGEIIVGKKPSSVALADLDNDGDLDLAVALKGVDKVAVYLNLGTPLADLPDSFALTVKYPVGSQPACVAAGDVTGDGLQDLVVACQGASTLTVLPGIGAGLFGSETTWQVGANVKCVVANDLNGDGDLDLAAPRTDQNKLKVLLNSGGGSFADQVGYSTGDKPNGTVVGDFDGDGDLDVVVANKQSNSVSILENLGSGAFAAALAVSVPPGPTALACADLDGDGLPDLVSAGAGFGDVAVMFNESQ